MLFLAGLAVLTTARWLEPSPYGVGTHTELGLPPCTMLQLSGMPCPSCGMTTAFAFVVRGRLFSAIHVQPAGTALAITTLIITILALECAISGRFWYLNPLRLPVHRLLLAFVVLICLSWGYKVLAIRYQL